MPTTATSDFASAPTVSLEKSILVGCCAVVGSTNDARTRAETAMALTSLTMFMIEPPSSSCWFVLVDVDSTTRRGRYRVEVRRKTRREPTGCRQPVDSPDNRFPGQ